MGILSDLLTGPIGKVGYGAMAESYERANKKADDQAELFRGLGVDLRKERMANEKDLNQKLSNFRFSELDFINNAKKYDLSGEYDGWSSDQLKLKFAPMAKYLKGDTFLGTPEEVQKKVADALFHSGSIKVGDPYTSVEEFTNKTKAAISGPLKRYSDMGYNTFQNQIGDLSYKAPEYNTDAVASHGLKITAANFQQWFPAVYGLDSPAVTAARLSILSENARVEALEANNGEWTRDTAFLFAELKDQKFKQVRDQLDLEGAALLLGFENVNEFLKLVESGSPSLAILKSTSLQIAEMDPSKPNFDHALYNELLQRNKNAISSHIQFLSAMSEGRVGDYLSKDSTLTTLPTKVVMGIMQHNFRKDVFKINKVFREVKQNPESYKGISFTDNGEWTREISGYEGRIGETFTFITVPQGLDAEGNALPKKWIIASDLGVNFELPNMAEIASATRKKYIALNGSIPKKGKPYQGIQLWPKATVYIDEKGNTQRLRWGVIRFEGSHAPTLDDFEWLQKGNSEVKTQSRAAIQLAMEGYLKLRFVKNDGSNNFIQDSTYVKELEDKGIFGTSTRSGHKIKYFGH